MQDGTKCRNPVNMSKCRFCDHHVQTESKRINSTRGVLQDSAHAAKLNTQAEKAGVGEFLAYGHITDSYSE